MVLAPSERRFASTPVGKLGSFGKINRVDRRKKE
jgi:hypothetical protein